jgi:hypothetical protein
MLTPDFKKMRIALYISDHGFGHASRQIALLRALARDPKGLEFLVRAGNRLSYVAKSTQGCKVRVVEGPVHEVGWVCQPGSMEVDPHGLELKLHQVLSEVPSLVAREARFCQDHRVKLIISDIIPWVSVVARSVGIPAIAISNFNWADAYGNVLGTDHAGVQAIRRMYGQFDKALILPLEDTNTPYRRTIPVGLLSKRPNPLRSLEIRRIVGNRAIYFGLGRSFDAQLYQQTSEWVQAIRDAGYSLVVSGDYGEAGLGALAIPETDTEGQDYLAACSLVVAKAGYSTVAEAVRARVPLVILYRPKISEDVNIAWEVRRLGIGVALPVGNVSPASILASIREAAKLGGAYELVPDRYTTDGVNDISKHLRDYG